MWLLGWRYTNHVLLLPSELRGPEETKGTKGTKGGNSQTVLLGMPNKIEIRRGSNSLTPRGVGGEGRVRNWRCIQHFRFTFVHVFNGYVASLSYKLTKIIMTFKERP